MLTIKKTIQDGKAVFFPEGRLDTNTAADFEHHLMEALPGLTELTLDLEKLDYISSAGLRVLFTAQKSMNGSQGKMKMIHVNETIMEIFNVTGFSRILNIE